MYTCPCCHCQLIIVLSSSYTREVSCECRRCGFEWSEVPQLEPEELPFSAEFWASRLPINHYYED